MQKPLKPDRKLIALRERLGLTQTAMAEKLGVHNRTYQQWELGRRKMNAAARKLIEILFGNGKDPT